MSYEASDLGIAAERLFKNLTERRGAEFAPSWRALEEMGFLLLLVPEESGGLGGCWSDALPILKAAGQYALPLPLAEAMLGERLAAESGIAAEQGITTVAWQFEGSVAGGRFSGRLRSVPWGREAARIVVARPEGDFILRVADALAIVRGWNIAGEPRDTLEFHGAPIMPAAGPSVLRLGALCRTSQIVGALHGALELTIGYANDRVQFGRSIGKFQVIQHDLAVFATETAAASAAGAAATRAADFGDADFEIAAAKIRANQAAAAGHAAAHAIHGAIGFTMEYPLNHLSRRLLSWRSEFGGQRYWTAWLGERAIQMGAEGFWETLTARSDALGLRNGG